MDFPCSECHYCDKCFPLLKLFSKFCEQGRRKKSQTKITDFPDEKKKDPSIHEATEGPEGVWNT